MRFEPLEERRLLDATLSGVPTWLEQGPRPIVGADKSVNVPDDALAGAIAAIAVNPNNLSQVFVATVNGGIWRTNNVSLNAGLIVNPGTIEWTPLTDQFGSLATSSIEFSPLDASGKTLYAGTGSFSNLGNAGGQPIGILRTTDGGGSWSNFAINAGNEPRISAVLPTSIDLDPAAGVSGMLLVAALGSSGGIYRSNDNGQSFALLSGSNGLPVGQVSDLIADPNNVNRFFAGIPGQGVFRGDFNPANSVITWTAVNTGVTQADVTSSGNVQLAVNSVAGSTTLFVGLADPDPNSGTGAIFNGVYRSTNAGANWVPLGVPPNFKAYAFGYSGFNLAADPSNAQVVYIAGVDNQLLYRHNGAAWVVISGSGTKNNTFPHADSRAMVFLGTKVLLESDDGGIYFLPNPTDASNNDWGSLIGSPTNGKALGVAEITRVAWDSNSNVIIAGSQDNGTERQQTPSNVVWSQMLGGDGQGIVIDTATIAGKSIRYFSTLAFEDHFSRQVYDNANNLETTVDLNAPVGFKSQFNTPIAINAIPPTPAELAANQSTRITIGGDEQSGAITGATNANPIVITSPGSISSPGHKLVSGTRVVISNVNGNTAANGTFIITKIDDNTFSLNGSDGTASGAFVASPSAQWRRSGEVYEARNAGTAAMKSVTWTQVPLQLAADQSVGAIGAIVAGGKLNGVDNPDLLYIGAGAKIFVRTTAGGPLVETPAVFPGGTVRSIAIDPTNWRHAFAADNVSVWETLDAGTSWVDTTGNLSNTDLHTVEFVELGPVDAVLLGGIGGVFRMLTNNPSTWSELGQNLPNAVTFDLEYNAADDVLVAGTLGRGAWLIPNASSVLLKPPILQICGEENFPNQDDTFRLVRDANNNTLLNVFINGVLKFTRPLAVIQQINVWGAGGNDNLIVDSSNGLIDVPNGIRYDGDNPCPGQANAGIGGFDRLTLEQPGNTTARLNDQLAIGATPGSGRSKIDDGGVNAQVVSFINLEPVVDIAPAATFSITSIPGLASLLQAANEIHYDRSQILIDPKTLLPTGGRITVDDFEPIEFRDKTAVVIDAGAGRDNVVLRNPSSPAGLQSIVVNAGAADDIVTILALPAINVNVEGEEGNDTIDSSGNVASTLTLRGGDGNDVLTGGGAGDTIFGGAGDDTLVESFGNDTYSGDAGFDTILVKGTPAPDAIVLNQTSATNLNVNVTLNGATNATNNTISALEAARVEAGDGDDQIAINVADTLISPGGGGGAADTDLGSLTFRVSGGSPNASDRLVVRDDGLGDLVLHRQGTDGRSGSIRVGPLQPVDYQDIEFVDVTPLNTVTNGTGTDGSGRLIVIHPDAFESNPSRLIATPLGGLPGFWGQLNIDPGPTVLPAPIGSVSGDEDWFEFRPQKIGTFRFDVLFEQLSTLANSRQGLPNSGDLQIEIRRGDTTGTLIVPSNVPGNNESLTISTAADTSYFLRVLGTGSAINFYDLRITEVDLVGPQVVDPDGVGPLTGIHVSDDGATAVNEAAFNLFDTKPTAGPTPSITRLTINFQDLPARAPGDPYPALDPLLAAQTDAYHLVGDHIGVVPIASVNVISNAVPAVGAVATATIELVFAGPLADDRYTLTVSDSLLDPAGNRLDGESDAEQPSGAPTFPSGDGLAGGDFVARFTVDSLPEIGVASSTSVQVDTNGNFFWDPTNSDQTNRDLTYVLGNISDYIFAGNFAAPGAATADGFDKLAAYGRIGGQWRWRVDINNDGVPDLDIVDPAGINGFPFAGNFDGNSANGDEVGVFDGVNFWLDTDHNYLVDTKIASDLRGHPIAGDFDGDGSDDLGTYRNDRGDFEFDLSGAPGGLNGTVDAVINFDFPGVMQRPVAADMDRDGIDDIGLRVSGDNFAGASGVGEWYFLVSRDPIRTVAAPKRIPGTVVTLDHAFSPTPLGGDLFARFGDELGIPLVGNFDPPLSATSGKTVSQSQAGALVAALYQDILGRPADAGGLSFYVDQIEQGATSQQVAHWLLNSRERYGRVVDGIYVAFLHRGADAGGREAWVQALAGGAGEDDIAAAFLDSAEYAARQASDGSYIDGLYRDVLVRGADSSGRSTWLGALAGGRSRADVARSFLRSRERHELVVGQAYRQVLHRRADALGMAWYADQLATQENSARELVAALAASDEYFARVFGSA